MQDNVFIVKLRLSSNALSRVARLRLRTFDANLLAPKIPTIPLIMGEFIETEI